MKSKLKPSGHQFAVCHHKCREQLTVDLLGGYQSDTKAHIVILFRYHGRGGDEQRDGSLLLFGRRQGFVVPENLSLDVESGDWNRFADLPVGAPFRLDGRLWVKMSISDIKKKIRSPIRALGDANYR